MLDTKTETEEAPTNDWERTRAQAILKQRRATIAQWARRLLSPRTAFRRWDSKLSILARHPLLANCSRAERRLFSWYADEVECPPGNVLVRKDLIGNWFFLIDSGTAELVLADRVAGWLQGGQYLGELALFGGGAHPATIRARTSLRLVVVHRRHFAALIDRIPRLRLELIASMTRRLRALTAPDPEQAPVLTPDLLIAPLPRSRWGIVATGRLAARIRRIALTVVLLTATGFVFAKYHPPVAVVEPGQTFDIAGDISITGTAIEVPTGKYLLTSIRVQHPNAFGLLLAAIRPDRELVPIPRNEDLEWVRSQQSVLFNESRLLAAAAAAKAQGMNAVLHGTGALVTGLIPESPAAGVLRRGDVITSVGRQEVSVAADAERLIKAHRDSDAVLVTLERDGFLLTVEVPLPEERRYSESALAIGAFVQTRDLTVELPFEIEFKKRDIGGPSAGLVYALAISDMLNDADYAGGRSVAATGTIDADGRVGTVGGLRHKAESSHRAGASIFFVPTALVDEVSGQPFLVLGVGSLKDALRLLAETQL